MKPSVSSLWTEAIKSKYTESAPLSLASRSRNASEMGVNLYERFLAALEHLRYLC